MSKRQPTRLEVLVMEPRIVLLYESGMTIKDLIPIVKLGRRSILSVLKKHGITLRNHAPRKPPLKREVITIPITSHKLLSESAFPSNPSNPSEWQCNHKTTEAPEAPGSPLHDSPFHSLHS